MVGLIQGKVFLLCICSSFALILFRLYLLMALLWGGLYAVLFPLHPISASNLLTVEFALEVRSDPQFSALPKAIHFSGEMRSKLR